MLTAFNTKLLWFLHVLSHIIVPHLISNGAIFAVRATVVENIFSKFVSEFCHLQKMCKI